MIFWNGPFPASFWIYFSFFLVHCQITIDQFYNGKWWSETGKKKGRVCTGLLHVIRKSSTPTLNMTDPCFRWSASRQPLAWPITSASSIRSSRSSASSTAAEATRSPSQSSSSSPECSRSSSKDEWFLNRAYLYCWWNFSLSMVL